MVGSLAWTARRERAEADSARAQAEASRDESLLARGEANLARASAETAQAEALSRQLALQATILKETDFSLSSQVALVAYQTSPTVEARSAVIDASSLPGSARYLGAPGPTALAVSSDNRSVLFSNSVDGSLSLLQQGPSGFEATEAIPLPDSEATVYALDFSPDGSFYASAGADRAVTLWSPDGQQVRLSTDIAGFEGSIQTLAIAEDGRTIYAGAEGPGIGRWLLSESSREEGAEQLPMPGEVMSLSLDHDRNLLAVAMRDGSVLLIDPEENGSVLWAADPADDTIASTIAVSPSAPTIVAGYRNSTIRIWDASEPTDPIEIATEIEPFASWVTWVTFSPSGATLAAGSSDGSVRLFDTTTWGQIGTALKQPTAVTALRFLDENSLVAAVSDGSVRIWDLAHESFEGLGASVWSTSFDASGEKLVAASGLRAAVWSFDAGVSSGKDLDLALPDDDLGLTGAAALSPDGAVAALGTRTGPVYLVPTARNAPSSVELEGLTNLVENVAFSSSGEVLVGGDDDGRVQIWTMSGGSWRAAGQFRIEDQAMNVAISPTTPLVAAASDEGPVHLVDISDPDNPVELSQVSTGDSIAFSVAFHPQLPLLVTGSADTSIRIWDYSDPANPELASEVAGPNSRIFSVGFSNSGDRLAAAVGDNTAWVWRSDDDATAWTLESVFSSPGQAVLSVTFSPDDQTVVGAGSDQHLLVWELDDSAVLGSICSKVGDDITEDEWKDLVPTLEYMPPCRP
ncbi:MAG: hypothetical protein ACRBK7_13045 [Acidimicrobiales bacterium]